MIGPYLSQKLRVFSVLGAFLVVLIHVPHPTYRVGSLSFWVVDVFCDTFTRLAVPFFFCCSGMLLSRDFSPKMEWWRDSLIKRVKSLLVPFVIANSLMALYLICRALIAALMKGRELMAFWGEVARLAIKASGLNILTFPLVGSTWFIRNLYILVVIAPILLSIARIGRKARLLFLMLAGVLWMSPLSDMPVFRVGFSLEALFWFFFGCAVGIAGASHVYSGFFARLIASLLVLASLSVGTLARVLDLGAMTWAFKATSIVMGLIGCWIAYDVFFGGPFNALALRFSGCSFWIYLYQFLPLLLLSVFPHIPIHYGDWLGWCEIFVLWFLVCFLLIKTGAMLRREVPFVWRFLNGFRG